MVTDRLIELAQAAGIVANYLDTKGEWHETSRGTARHCLESMGISVSTEAEIEDAFQALLGEHRDGGLPRWLVIEEGQSSDLPIGEGVEWQLELEGGALLEGRGPHAVDAWPPGIHVLHLGDNRSTVISAPKALNLPERGWGVNVPLSGLWRQERNGIGNYETLEQLGLGLAAKGARFVGCNPIHAGFPSDPTAFSPYSPSHRRRVNILHIALPGDGQERPSSSGADLIDFEKLIPEKLSRLRERFDAMEAAGANQALEAYIDSEGIALEEFAIHQALSNRLGPYWCDWPLAEQFPSPQVIETARREMMEDIRFHSWLQFEAERQLRNTKEALGDAGMRHGLYLDLAVGTHPHGAETWGDRHLFAERVSLGAPPDPLGPDGQRWGLAPFNPRALVQDGFRSFAETLRRQLRFAGLLRIDHILGFERAFWVPDDPSLLGTYVNMPAEALLAVTRLEAARAGAIIIGEDLGNIPAGLQTRLSASGILGCRLAMFERDHENRFKDPQDYDEAAIASFGTHDLPTWRGWRSGFDLGARAAIGAMDDESLERSQIERSGSVNAVDQAIGSTAPGPDPIHHFLAKSASRLVMVQIEDILELESQANLPGTIQEYPNWRRRLPIAVEAINSDPRTERTAAIMIAEGR